MHASICDIITDCLQNSVEAEAKEIILTVRQESEKRFCVNITDNGKGMDEVTLARARDPFFTDGVKHKNRKVGLGLPFLLQTTSQANGDFSIDSNPGKGTTLEFAFDLTNIDTPPFGNLPDTFLQCFMFSGDFELTVKREFIIGEDVRGYEVRRSELIDALGDLSDSDSLILARDFLRSHEEEIAQE